jgi:hypothetical protein
LPGDLILGRLSKSGQRHREVQQNAPKRQPGYAGSLRGAKEVSEP